MPRIIILTAPQGAGKTRYAHELARALGCQCIVDEFDGSQRLYPGTLALTCLEPDELDVPAGAEIVRARDMADIGQIIERGAACMRP